MLQRSWLPIVADPKPPTLNPGKHKTRCRRVAAEGAGRIMSLQDHTWASAHPTPSGFRILCFAFRVLGYLEAPI